MEMIRGNFPLRPGIDRSVVTIGKFDGVHRGHQRLIRETVAEAGRLGCASVVVTFDRRPGPAAGSDEGPEAITPLSEKARIIGELGIDVLWVVPFDERFARLTPRAFVREILCGQLGLVRLVVGPDFRFGRNRSGTISSLVSFGKEFSFGVSVVPFVREGEIRISSTEIRSLIRRDELESASRMLGRAFALA